jgi:hypothetical protein
VPQTVTVFLDKEEKIDLDKVQIEATVDGYQGNSAEEQKRIEEMFKDAAKSDAEAAAKAASEPAK